MSKPLDVTAPTGNIGKITDRPSETNPLRSLAEKTTIAVYQTVRKCAEAMCEGCLNHLPMLPADQTWHDGGPANWDIPCKAMPIRRKWPEAFK